MLVISFDEGELLEQLLSPFNNLRNRLTPINIFLMQFVIS